MATVAEMVVKIGANIDNFDRNMTKLQSSMKSIGSKMTNAGKLMTAGVTVPLVGLGTAAVMTGAKFDAQMSKVQAISGATGRDFNALREQAKDLGATTRFSASEAAEGMEFLARAGWKTKDIMAAMPGMLNLAAAGALDLGSAADITSNIMTGFGIEANKAGHVADVLAYAAANANTDVQGLGDAMKYLAPVAQSMGWELEEATAAVMALSDAGIQGEQAGAAFATSIQRLTKPTGEAKKILAQLGMSFFDTSGKMKPLPDIIKELETKTKGMTDQQKAATLTTLFGAEAYKHWSVLLNRGSKDLSNMTGELKTSDGTASKMAKTMQDNLNGALTELKSALEGLAIAFGETLTPMIRGVAEWLTKVTRSFTDMSDGAKKAVVVIAGIAAAIGPLLIVGGSLLSLFATLGTVAGILGVSVGALVGIIGAVVAAIAVSIGWAVALYKNWDNLEKKFGTVGTVLISLVSGPFGAIVGAIKLFQKANEDALPKADHFGNKVSESTKKALGGYLELEEKASVALKELAWSGDEVTKGMANKITNTFAEMSEKVVNSLEKQKNDSLKTMESFFAENSAMTDEEEAKILEKINSSYEDRKKRVEEGENRVKEILKKAKDEKRALTDQERMEINAIREQMKTEAIQTMTKNEEEQRIILERMKENASITSAQEAAEVIKNSVKKRDKVIQDAEDQFLKVKMEAERQRDEVGSISAEEAEKIINEARKQRDETVENAKDRHEKIVSTAQKQAGEHADLVDWETGEILSKWDIFKQGVGKILDAMVKDVKKQWDDMWNRVDKVAEWIKTKPVQKFESLKKRAVDKFESLKKGIRNKMEDAKDAVKNRVDKIKSFFDNLKLKIPRPKIPKISLSKGTKSIGGIDIPYPKFSFDGWYAKGGLFDRPSIIGVGEAGPEAVVPLRGSRMKPFAAEVARHIGVDQREPETREIPEYVMVNVHLDGRQIAQAVTKPSTRMQNRTQRRNAAVRGNRK